MARWDISSYQNLHEDDSANVSIFGNTVDYTFSDAAVQRNYGTQCSLDEFLTRTGRGITVWEKIGEGVPGEIRQEMIAEAERRRAELPPPPPPPTALQKFTRGVRQFFRNVTSR